jgi:prepilin-type N-terminal cleavage/methylation domain-containing protein
MNTSRQHSASRFGFTLIELLVVISLIAVLSAGVGMVLTGGGDRANAMKTAQATLSSVLAGARAQAALHGSSASIYVNADPASVNFLREIRVVVPNGANLTAKGDPIMLPKGVYLVPPSNAFTAAQVEFKVPADWTDLYSNIYVNTDEELTDSAGNKILTSGTTVSEFNRLSSFKIQGTTGSGKIVLAPADLQDGKVVFDRPDAVRGMLVSQYGVSTFVNEASAFRP